MNRIAALEELAEKVPHDWLPSRLGHGEWMCRYCLATNREIAVIGDPNHCQSRALIAEGKGDD